MTTTDNDNRPPPMRVFLAEDDREMRQMIAVTLRRDGHFVIESSDGLSLITDVGHVFWSAAGDDTRTLIITDIRMPGRDGLSIMRDLRHYPWCPPFIVITGFGDPEAHAEAQRLGAVAVLDKPFDLDILRAQVNELARAVG
jgi:DNA-binding response OmpR family regulator